MYDIIARLIKTLLIILIKSSNFVQSCSSGRHGMETSLTVTLDDISCTSGSLFLPFQNKTWILFHNFSPFESSVAGTFSRIPRNHFSIFSRFQPSNIEKKNHKNDNKHKYTSHCISYFVLHCYRIYSKTGGKQIRTRGADACQRLLSTDKNSPSACAVKRPSADTAAKLVRMLETCAKIYARKGMGMTIFP